VTHLHTDHAGGAAALSREGRRILAHPWTAIGLMTGDEARAGLDRARGWSMYPSDQHLEPSPAVESLGHSAHIDLGRCLVHVIETPGHVDSHLSLLVERDDNTRALIAGDLVFPGGRSHCK
jgi:glyoxylase-like metal-dependent hydrolase (beta-lactamase superfamily II)